MKSVTVLRSGGYKQKPYHETVEYPDNCSLYYDQNQGVLQIKRPSGEPVAAFRCPSFTVDAEVMVGEAVVYDPPGFTP